MKRSEALKSIALAATLPLTGLSLQGAAPETPADMTRHTPRVRTFRHSVCRWCYSHLSLEQLCDEAKAIGIESVELLNPDEWQVPLDRGMTCALSFGSPLGIANGFNDPKYHAQLLKDYQDLIPRAADLGLQQMIVFSGNRNGISEEQGLENCAVGLDPVAKIAEKHGIMLTMELLNSKVNHPDYQCDHTPWGVELCEKLGSDSFKLLYDIYHMQIMEGDVIATIQKYHTYISHYHTGGVPGRHEIDDTQELYYPAIMRAISATGFTGFVAQEFIPAGDSPMASLKKAVEICSV